jgi:hypothetical protein
MSTTTAIEANAVNNNGSTLMGGGNTTNANVSLGVTKQELPSVINPTNTSGTARILSCGIFEYNTPASEVLALGLCDSINGSATNVIRFTGYPSDQDQDSILNIDSRRTMHITSWDYATGVATKGDNTTDDFGTDNAAALTAAVPGNIVILETGKTPTTTSI